jgi:hypothetical protein
MDDLTQQEKKQLRLARFGSLGGKGGAGASLPGIEGAATTVEAM